MRHDDTKPDASRASDAIDRDDRALDALLGLGDPVDARADDPAMRLLAAWHADLSADDPLPVRAAAPDTTRVRRRAPAAAESDRTRPGRRTSRRRRGGRLALATGVAVLATTGFAGVAMAAGGASPGSPLFPVTKVIYPDRAAVREHQAAAAHDLASARQAAKEGRDDDARRYLDDADRHSREMPSSAADAVRRDTAKVRRGLGNTPSPQVAEDGGGVAPPSTASSPSTDPSSAPPASVAPEPPVSPSPSEGSASTDSADSGQSNASKSHKNKKKHSALSLAAWASLLR
ncbi:MAG TPA: hypothetical protein VGN37_05465 [Actinocatenispora sp.]